MAVDVVEAPVQDWTPATVTHPRRRGDEFRESRRSLLAKAAKGAALTTREESGVDGGARPGVSGASSPVVLVITGPMSHADVPGLVNRVRRLPAGADGDVVVCDVGGVTDPDLCTVDALARLQLTARGLGRGMRLRHASSQLRELLVFAGLDDVVSFGLRRQPRGQAEDREQPGRVQEGVHPDDPTG